MLKKEVPALTFSAPINTPATGITRCRALVSGCNMTGWPVFEHKDLFLVQGLLVVLQCQVVLNENRPKLCDTAGIQSITSYAFIEKKDAGKKDTAAILGTLCST